MGQMEVGCNFEEREELRLQEAQILYLDLRAERPLSITRIQGHDEIMSRVRPRPIRKETMG